jgi:hypothetical protein
MSENDDNNNEEYNNYVLSDGIWAKIDAQTNADILDMLYTKARKKIRQRGGMLSTQDALELVMKEDREEMINDIVQDLRKEGYHLLADAFQNESTRKDAIHVLRSIISDMEDPNKP